MESNGRWEYQVRLAVPIISATGLLRTGGNRQQALCMDRDEMQVTTPASIGSFLRDGPRISMWRRP
jgi:hypothetical protein